MTTALAPIGNLQERLREKVKDALFDLIPPEALDAFITETWNRLTAVKTRDEYGRPLAVEQPSELGRIIETEMKARMVEIVKEWSLEWKKGGEASDMSKAVLMESTRAAAEAHIQSVASAAAQTAAYNVANSMNRSCKSCGRSGVQAGSYCSGCNSYAAY